MAFQPNCTLPVDRVVYVASPNIRSTLDILWPSLATIIACTYTVLHLSVPEQRLGRDKGLKGDLKWTLRRLGQSLKWSCINILAPEIILSKAIADWYGARKQLRELHKAVPATKETWTMTHMLFADMGGFVIGYDAALPGSSDLSVTQTDLYDRNAGAEKSPSQDSRRPSDDPGGSISNNRFIALTENRARKVFHLRARTFRIAIESELLASNVASVDEILDRSKNDSFTKVFAMGQTLYYVVEVLTRASRGLPVSPMELGVTGFVACSLGTYAFSLQKPKAVCEAIKVGVFEKEIPLWLRNATPGRDVLFGRTTPHGCPSNNIELPDEKHFDDNMCILVSTPIFILFGAVHLAGWNLIFPTANVDKWLWRTAAISSTVLYPLSFGINGGLVRVFDLFRLARISNFLTDHAEFAVGIPIGVLYAISRLIIIGEMVRCLFYLPPEAFVATWTANIPHVG